MADPVPLLDLKAQFEEIRDEVTRAVLSVLESQRFIFGPEVESLEKEIAAYCGAPRAVGVSSGTDALLVTLMALGVGPGDEVVTSPFTFFATAGSIHRLGARPVFVDIRPDTFNLDPEKLEAALTEKTKAVIAVHIFGQCAEIDRIREITDPRGIPVVEDAAQAIGASWKGKKAGTLGRAGCFSFFPSKNLGGLGDGGMVVSTDPDLAEKVRLLRHHGQTDAYRHSFVGGNFRLDALQAAALRVKLRRLDAWSAARAQNAAWYAQAVQREGLGEFLTPPAVLPGAGHVFNQFTLRARDRDALKDHLKSRGIGHAVYYPLPLHLQPCFSYLGYKEGDFPVSEKAAREVISLPVFPELTPSQRERILEALKTFYLGS